MTLVWVYAAREGVSAKQSLGIFTSRIAGRGVGRNVVLLGLTSFFTDISSEMVSSTLPLYAIFFLGFTPLQFGLLDGLYQGSSAVVRIVGGVTADRLRRHKEVATAGYALSAVAKVGLLASGPAFWSIAAAILTDRAGKGIRTAPRDALISLSAEPPRLASAFALHRALDTLGALAGPLVAVAILTAAPRAFDAVFLTSLCFAIVGLSVIGLFVKNRARPAPGDHERSKTKLSDLMRQRAFMSLVIAAVLLALATVSDGFLYVVLQRRLDLAAGVFPLLSVVTALVYFALALPAGRLADKVGRVRVFLGGYALLPVVYVLTISPALTPGSGLAALIVFGIFYAATDGVLAALASSLLPPDVRASGLAMLGTAVAVTRIAASVIFGALWSVGGLELAMFSFAASGIAAVAAGAVILRRVGSAHAW